MERDPNGERTRWRKCSEIANHAMAREMAELSVTDSTITLDLPVRVPEFTLRVTGAPVRGVAVDGQPLTSAPTRAAFEDNSFYRDGDVTFAAFAPGSRHSTVEILH